MESAVGLVPRIQKVVIPIGYNTAAKVGNRMRVIWEVCKLANSL